MAKADASAALGKGSPVVLAGYGIDEAPAPTGPAPKPTKPKPSRPAKPKPTLTTAAFAVPGPTPAPAGDPNQGVGVLREVEVASQGFGPKGIDLYLQGPAGHSSCSGDSGGPSTVQVDGETYVVGVLSRGDCNEVSIYTFVNSEIVSGL